MPTLMTSIENTAAAIGVPNTAEKQALMPHIIISFLSFHQNERSEPKITEASANLQGSTFTTGRTAEQMGDQRRYKDQWCYFDRNMVVRLDGGQNQIGSCIVVLTAYPVEKKNNQQTGKG